MPIYTVQGPDGRTYDVQGPEGATADQLGTFITSQQGQQQVADYRPQGDAENGGVWAGIKQGLRDPIDAGAQMLRRAVPDSVGNAIDAMGNKLAALGFPVAPSNGVQGVDAIVNNVNSQYEADRNAAGRGGIDWARMGGDVLGTAPVFAGGLLAAGATLPARIGIGATQGGAGGLLMPVVGANEQADFTKAKRNQGLAGAALGGLLAPIASGVARITSPEASLSDSAAKLLQREGIALTPGQAAGGAVLATEDKLMSVPLLGDAIRGARNRANDQLNRAVYNRVLQPIGGSTDKLGRDAVADVTNQVHRAYDDVLSKVQFAPDAQFTADLQRLQQQAAQALPQREADAFTGVVQREVMGPLAGGNPVSGDTFKTIESQLSQQAMRFGKSPDAYQKGVGDAIGGLQQALRDALQRTNPEQAPRLADVNKSFAMLTRLQKAAASQKATDGVFTPAQFTSAVRGGDMTVRKNAFAQGKALMQDLSDAAGSHMMSSIPNSGTTDRFLLNAGLAGGLGYLNPWALGGLAATAIPYLPGISQVASRAVTSRPSFAPAIASAIRKAPVGLLAAPLAR